MSTPDHRKQLKRYHEPGDLHELTFSCYRRLPLLTDGIRCGLLCKGIDVALKSQGFALVAFVIMPDHVHLLVYPLLPTSAIDRFLYDIKRPFSGRMKRMFVEQQCSALEELTVQERPGKTVFRFWQEGGGYDRNLSSQKAVLSGIDYIHNNPVRRGLARMPGDWKWSSARWYVSDRETIDAELPRIDGLPPEFFV